MKIKEFVYLVDMRINILIKLQDGRLAMLYDVARELILAKKNKEITQKGFNEQAARLLLKHFLFKTKKYKESDGEYFVFSEFHEEYVYLGNKESLRNNGLTAIQKAIKDKEIVSSRVSDHEQFIV